MIAVGEETGELDKILQKLAGFYEEEIDNMTKNLTSIIEPVLLIVIGVAVGFLVISIILPLYNMQPQ
jgi:type II secretory pathway component PulF